MRSFQLFIYHYAIPLTPDSKNQAESPCFQNLMKNLIDGSVPDMEKREGEYQKPRFGTFEEWYNFIDAYIISRYQFVPELLTSSAKLIEAAKNIQK